MDHKIQTIQCLLNATSMTWMFLLKQLHEWNNALDYYSPRVHPKIHILIAIQKHNVAKPWKPFEGSKLLQGTPYRFHIRQHLFCAKKIISSNHSRLAMGDKTTEEFRVSHRGTFLELWNHFSSWNVPSPVPSINHSIMSCTSAFNLIISFSSPKEKTLHILQENQTKMYKYRLERSKIIIEGLCKLQNDKYLPHCSTRNSMTYVVLQARYIKFQVAVESNSTFLHMQEYAINWIIHIFIKNTWNLTAIDSLKEQDNHAVHYNCTHRLLTYGYQLCSGLFRGRVLVWETPWRVFPRQYHQTKQNQQATTSTSNLTPPCARAKYD